MRREKRKKSSLSAGIWTRRFLESFTVTDNDKIRQIDAGDVYYFEAVDNKVFLYLEQGVYEIKYKLYEIEEEYANTDFFRASKSVIINLAKVKQFAPDFGGRFEAQMKNGEKLIISRQYAPSVKRRIREILLTFCMVTTGSMFVSAAYIKVFWPGDPQVNVDILWQIPVIAFVCSLGNFIHPYRAVSRRRVICQKILHYLYINAMVLGGGYYFAWIEKGNMPMLAVMYQAKKGD